MSSDPNHHFDAAERILAEVFNEKGSISLGVRTDALLQAAQVHATLALAYETRRAR